MKTFPKMANFRYLQLEPGLLLPLDLLHNERSGKKSERIGALIELQSICQFGRMAGAHMPKVKAQWALP